MVDRKADWCMSTFLKTIVAAVAIIALTGPNCSGQDFVTPPPEFSRYTLSNIRYDSDRFGRSFIAVDYKRTKEGKGDPQLSGKTDDGSLRILNTGVNKASGTLSFKFAGSGASKNVELYFIASGAGGITYLISNTVRLGNPGATTTARALNDKDKAKIAKAISYATPPSALPSDFVAVTSDTLLIPGMPVKAGLYEKWENAEVISLRGSGNVGVKYEGQDKLLDRSREKWLAVDPKVLAEAKANPGKFSPSVQVLPGGVQAIPAGAIPLPDEIDLPSGTPLLLDYHDSK